MTGAGRDGGRLARVGVLAAVVSRVLGRLVGIVLVVLLAREATPDTVAVYGYLLGTATLVATLTDLGVAAIAGREVAAGRFPAGATLWAALGPHAVSVAGAGLVTVLLTQVLGPDVVPLPALALTVGFVVAGGFVNLWAEMLRATGRVLLEGALQVGSAVALVLGGVLVLRGGGGATALLAVVALKEVAVLAIMVFLLRPERRPRLVRGRMLLGQSLWLAVAGIGVVLLWRQGTVVLGAVGTVGALAVYVVASRFLDAGVTIAHTAGFGLMPGMSALTRDPAAFRREARRYLALAAVVGLVVAVVGVLAARPITVIPFGERWESAVPAVRAIALAGLPILLTYTSWNLLLARGQIRRIAAGSVAGALTGIVVGTVAVLGRPDAESAVLGTAVGATVLAVVLLSGLYDVLAPNSSARHRASRTTRRRIGRIPAGRSTRRAAQPSRAG